MIQMCHWTRLSYVNYCFDLGFFFSANDQYFFGVVTQPSVSSDWCFWEEQSKCVVRRQETCAAGNIGFQRDTQVVRVLMKKSKSGRLLHANPTAEQCWLPFSQPSSRISIENRWLALHNACNPT